MYTINITSGPSSEPITAAEVKLWCRINSGTAEDALLSDLIVSARNQWESLTGRLLGTQTVVQSLEHWPTGVSHYYRGIMRTRPEIILMRAPVQSITSVKFYDSDDDLEVFTDYDSDIVSTPAKVIPHTIPAHRTHSSPIAVVTYVAGYTAIPKPITVGLRLLVAHLYRHREPVLTGTIQSELPLSVRHLISQYDIGVRGDWGQ